jgi:hypothetical protein
LQVHHVWLLGLISFANVPDYQLGIC